jgi:hypothetical protein
MLKKKLHDKKGFALQFTWLFVLIGGAVFLGFFISLINNMDKQAKTSVSLEFTQELDSLLKISSIAGAGELEKVVFFGEKEKNIIFQCEPGVSEYYFEGSTQKSRYDFNAIFSPPELRGKQLVIKTVVFEAPYRIMPLVYVTNKETEYVFVGNNLQRISSMMPENATVTIYNSADGSAIKSYIQDYPDNNYDRTVFVLNDSAYLPAKVNNFQNKTDRLFAVVITSSNFSYNYGNLTFFTYNATSTPSVFQKQGEKGSPFIEFKLATGGIISHNKDIYDCNFLKVKNRMWLLSKLYQSRMEYFSGSDQNTPECQSFYSGGQDALGGVKALTGEKDLSTDDFNNLMLYINDLATLNKFLLEVKGCPRIY